MIHFLLAAALLLGQENLPPPYNTAEILPFLDHGWYANKTQIEWLIKKHNIKTIIEVGSWLGTSTRHMAACIPEDGIVYAVDHWKGSVENQPGQWASLPGVEMEKLYDYFLSNAVQSGLAHKIVPVRMESLQAAAALNIRADLVYIDAAHDEESVYNDLIAWCPHVKPNGIFCGDDWTSSGVRKAVISFAQMNGFRFKAKGNFWMLNQNKAQRPKH